MTTRSIVIILLFIIGLIPEAYGVSSVNGIKLDRLKEKLELPCTDDKTPAFTHLNNLFQNVAFQETTNEEVSIQLLLDEVSCESFVDTDTDDESSIQSEKESKIKSVDTRLGRLKMIARKVEQNGKLNRSRHSGKATNKVSYDSKNNYLNKFQNPVLNTGESASRSPTGVDKLDTQSLRNRLTSDAFLISESGVTDRPGSTTCLCVALRDKHKYVKKFVFHNGENLLARDMREEANKLGYDVIQTEQSHAEGQLIQFLLRREQVRPGWYTHILGMGCSRSHCVECDSLLKLCLGANYHRVTSSVNTKNEKAGDIETSPPDTIKTRVYDTKMTARDTGELVVDKRVERIATVVHGQDAVGKSSFEKFYLPLVLQDIIQEKLDTTIDFSDERFTKSKKRAQQTRQAP